ncbi:hypothetical protein RJ639_019380 [Escallonia herrerae]|uniref:Reverse transcriptase Ty1/copia-type domain-containing protein n=1 Tax=Escallonia herrerae TaxID=1293975 RepID=A0AA88V7R8_9ASTE|nr:hypothetical protein RJ639_019380 [Escallonia herrerae]
MASETILKSGPVHPNVQHGGGTVYATPYVVHAHGSIGLGERPEKFNGKDFKRRQHKILFYLTTLNLARFLQEDAPDLGENPDWQTVAAVDAWKHSDFLCKNYILNGLDNALRDGIGESFQVTALIEKLPPTWKDFKNYLKHKHKEMKLEDLIVRLRIKEDNRQSEKKASNYHQEAKANVAEQVAQERSSLERTNMDQEPSQEEDEPKRSKRARMSTSFGPDFLTYLLENEPRSYCEAMSSPEAPHWKEAINSEIESIMQNHTWELVDLPPENKPLGCHWIFKRKMKADGTIEKYKAIITSIQILIVIAAINNLEIHQMDVKTTFLNGEIYMEQPEGFVALDHKRKKELCAIALVRRVYNLECSYIRRIAVVSWETTIKRLSAPLLDE